MMAWSVCAEDATSYRSFVCLAAVTSLMPPSLQWDSTVPDSSEKNTHTYKDIRTPTCFSIHKISLAGSVTTVICENGIESSLCISIFASFWLPENVRIHTKSPLHQCCPSTHFWTNTSKGTPHCLKLGKKGWTDKGTIWQKVCSPTHDPKHS